MRNRTISIVCMLLCLLGISRVSFAQQEDNLLRREYQVAMEEHVQNMIAALERVEDKAGEVDSGVLPVGASQDVRFLEDRGGNAG